MRKITGLIFGLIAMFLFAGNANATLIDGYITGDNIVWAWGYDGAGNWNGSSWYQIGADWRYSYHIWGNVNHGETNYVYFAVEDVGGPAGFLAEFTAASGIFNETSTNKLYSDVNNWKIVIPTAWGAGGPVDPPTGLSGWAAPTSWGPNITGSNYSWTHVDGIANNAEWIWYYQDDGPGYGIVRTRFTLNDPSAIPEPASLSLLGLGLFGLFRLKTRKR